MTRLIRRYALFICILAVTTQASAEVVLLSQSRSVYGNAEAHGTWGLEALDSDSLAAPDFGLFEEELSIEAVGVEAWARVSVTQNSEIQTGHFSIHGSSTAIDFATYTDFSWVFGSAHSDFEVLFEVSTPTPFSLIGTLATTGGDVASLQLDRDGAPYLSFNIDINSEIAVNEGGILEPGAYILTVNASSSYLTFGGGGGSSSFDIDFFMETSVAVEEISWGQVKAMFR